MKIVHPVIIIFSAMLLTNCASGPMLKKQTKDTIDAGNEVKKQSMVFFDSLLILQDQNAAIIYATHPECIPNDSNTIRYNTNQTTGKSKLCLPLDTMNINAPSLMSLTPLDRTRFQTDLEIISVFSDYLIALTQYTEDPKTPISDRLSTAIGNANNVKSLEFLNVVQKEAVTDLAYYLEKMLAEYQQGKNITDIVLKEGPTQQENIKKVKNDIDKMNALYKISVEKLIISSLANYYRENADGPEFNSYDKRISFYGKIGPIIQSTKSTNPASLAIEKFMAYHASLIDLSKGNLSEEQKASKLEIERKQLITGLKLIAELAKPIILAAVTL